MARIKKSRKESAVSNRKLEEHIVGGGVARIKTDLTQGGIVTDQKEVPWYANQVEAESDIKLEQDLGTGKPVILRRFEFKLPPGAPEVTKEELMDHHMKHIKAFLWRDELDLVLEPRIIMGKKGAFTIFCTCQPRLGSFIHERPQTLKEAANS